jgi:hypothetical protein
MLEEHIQDWYDTHINLIEQIYQKDYWNTLSVAIKVKFTDILLTEKYLDKLYNHVYDNNIQVYLNNLDNLNTFTYLSGLQLQYTIKASLLK